MELLMTLVVENKNDGPGTHVLVVGVGRYPFFPGYRQGMNTEGQIDSAEIGAQHVANWFANKFFHPTKPLASLRLLLSNEQGNTWVARDGAKPVDAATTENFMDAYTGWMADGNERPDNALVLYFAGHGIGNLEQQSLFCEDYNSTPARKMEGAIDYRVLERAIGANSSASHAWIFMDTCRGNDLVQTVNGEFGRKVDSEVGPIANPEGPRISTIFATAPGGQAHGNAGAPSFFSEAMVRAFETNAYCRRDGMRWGCFPDVAFQAISKQLERIYIREDINLATQRLPNQRLDAMDAMIHCLPPEQSPHMMVDISCAPEADNASHTIFWTQAGTQVTQQVPGQVWRTDMAPGKYSFGVFDRNGNRCRELEESVNLPFQQIFVV